MWREIEHIVSAEPVEDREADRLEAADQLIRHYRRQGDWRSAYRQLLRKTNLLLRREMEIQGGIIDSLSKQCAKTEARRNDRDHSGDSGNRRND